MRQSISIVTGGHTYIFLYEPTYLGMAKLLRHWTYLLEHPEKTQLRLNDLIYLYNCLRTRMHTTHMGF